jgi:hypothetical protein
MKKIASMKKTIDFKRWNNIIGLLAFLISFFIYISTLEPTVSFWDCGEFISCVSKLEICHAPGNPLFLLLGRMASLLAGNDHTRIAFMVNASSAMASAGTVMFLFWTITWFGRKLFPTTWSTSNGHKILILASGLIGAMAFAVSDSFWFSAVEAEVYAMSSLFMAIIFWCITRWEEAFEKSHPERWLLLIAYLFGLGIGVHLLNLLVIPSIVVLYYLKNHPLTWKITMKAILVSVILLGTILYLIIPGLPYLCALFERIAVNQMGMPFNSGYFMGIFVLVLGISFGLYFSYKKKKIGMFNGIIYISLIILGFSTYGVIIIRSHDNPPIDMNNPEDPFALQYYLNREQYEKKDLLHGPSFASPIIDVKERNSYERSEGKYISYPLNPQYIYDDQTMMLFPRMSYQDQEHTEAYKQWVSIKGRPYIRTNENGQQEQIILPTFGENIRFFFKYQLGYMYFRYFMWNFSGRQNDIAGHGNFLHGDWMTGISFIDNLILGNQDKLPSSLKHNPGRNTYFLLPFLLGIAGLRYHYKQHRKSFIALSLLFFFTGIAIVIFLNESPVVPRERDYVYVGSFYAFCIWIGIGVMGTSVLLEKWLKTLSVRNGKVTGTMLEQRKIWWAISLTITATAGIPLLMGIQNWDDHDRSGRYAVLEYARNYLESCAPNAILFTNADNDTYPLWYAQEVEGIRPDILIVLTPYLSADWYIDQLRQQRGNKPGLPVSIAQEKLAGGKRTYLPVVERTDTTVDLGSLISFVSSDDKRTLIPLASGKSTNYVPSPGQTHLKI